MVKKKPVLSEAKTTTEQIPAEQISKIIKLCVCGGEMDLVLDTGQEKQYKCKICGKQITEM